MRKNLLILLLILSAAGCDKTKPYPPPVPAKVGWIKGIRWKPPGGTPPVNWPIEYVRDTTRPGGGWEQLIAMGHTWEFEIHEDGKAVPEPNVTVDILILNPQPGYCSPASINVVACNNDTTGSAQKPGFLMIDDQRFANKDQKFIYLTKNTDNNGAFKLKIFLDRRLADKTLLQPLYSLNDLHGMQVWMRARVNDIGGPERYYDQFVYGAALWGLPYLGQCSSFESCQYYGYGSIPMTDANKATWKAFEDQYNQPRQQQLLVSDNPPWYRWVCGSPCAVDADTDSDGILDCLDACPDDPKKWYDAGTCPCGMPDHQDTDGDGIMDCFDLCPVDQFRVAPPCNGPWGDADSDGDIDQDDFGAYQRCVGIYPISAACRGWDIAHSGMVGYKIIGWWYNDPAYGPDDTAVIKFHECARGVGVPGNPSCMPQP